MRRPLLLLGLLASLLSAALALELRDGVPEAAPLPRAATSGAEVAAPSAAGDTTPERTRSLLAAILARPLFEQDRRPLAEAKAGPVSEGGARLAGIMISPAGRAAIFATSEGGKPTVLREGGVIGPLTVQTIAPGAVTVLSHGEAQVLHPSFAASTATTTAPAPPQFPFAPNGGMGRMPGLPGGVTPPSFTTSFAVPTAPPNLLGSVPGQPTSQPPPQPSPESRP